jgi:hypothetical protein
VISPAALAPVARIALRYAGGVLIAKGWAHDPSAFADPDLVQAVCYIGAGVCAVLSEGWYVLARKKGWR